MTNYADQAERIMDTHIRAAGYGVEQTSPLSAEQLAARDEIDYKQPQTMLSNPDLVKITRLRLLSDRGLDWWDVSYCHGELSDGTPVRVYLGDHHIRKQGWGRVDKGHLIELAKEAGRYAKGLGLLDDAVISTLQ
jgi:hypothetical protein